MATAKLALSFRILTADGALVREEKLTQSVIKIGKVSSAHLRIDADETVSRMHAIIEVVGDSASLIDLGSTGGTFVNGQKINKVALKTGDSIRVGSTLIEVGIAPAQATAPAVAFAPTVIVAPQVLPPPVPTGVRPTPAAMPVVTRTVTAPAPVAAPVAPLSPFNAAPVSPAAFTAATSDSVEDQGARAVEVAAMFGDSVVGVKHCVDPRGGKITSSTIALVAGGAACLVASAAAFALSVGTASRNDRAHEDHRALNKPEHAFKKEKQSVAVDLAAWGGLGLAMFGLTAGLVRYRRERKSPFYRIGTAPGVEQPIEQAPLPSFPLVAPSGDDFVFNFGAGMDGEMVVDGVSTPLAQLAEQGRARPSAATPGAIEVPIPARARICARLGMTKFLVSAVAAPRKQATPLFANLEGRTLAYLGGSLAAHLAVWAFLQTIPPEVSGVAVGADDGTQIAMRSEFKGHEDPNRDQEKTDPGDQEGEAPEGTEATAMTKPESKVGNPNLTNEARLTMENKNIDPVMAREYARQRARDAGILGAAREAIGDTAAAFAGIGNVTSGLDDATRWAGMTGEPGEGGGEFGGGRHPGDGGGGGCFYSNPVLCGTIGSSPYATNNKIGNWRGSKYGDPRFDGTGPGLKRTAKVPEVVFTPPTVDGSGLTKDIIKRYIKQMHERFKYCYESELLAHPGIEGGVAVSFLISPSGVVTQANASGFNGNVAQCVATTIRAINFPAPKDGSNVAVNYPFTFHAPK